MARTEGISATSVHKIWVANDLKPYLPLPLKLSNATYFQEKIWGVIGLYLDPPEKALVPYCDEKSQVKAVERTLPGRAVLSPRSLDQQLPALHQALVDVNEKINRETPKHLQLHLIVDNYTTHKHPNVKILLEKHARFYMYFTLTSSSWIRSLSASYAKNTVYLRGLVRELRTSITTILALRNASTDALRLERLERRYSEKSSAPEKQWCHRLAGRLFRKQHARNILGEGRLLVELLV